MVLQYMGLAQRLKRLPPMWETRVRSLGREDPLEKEMAIHSSILAWRIPWTEKPSRLQSAGSQRVGHDWATSPSFTFHRQISSEWSPLSSDASGSWSEKLAKTSVRRGLSHGWFSSLSGLRSLSDMDGYRQSLQVTGLCPPAWPLQAPQRKVFFLLTKITNTMFIKQTTGWRSHLKRSERQPAPCSPPVGKHG